MAEYIDREAFKKSVEERYCKPCKAEGKDHNRYSPCNRRNVSGDDFCSYGERKDGGDAEG